MPRPVLPVRYANPKIQHLLSSGDPLPPVKYQVLSCQGTDIVVGRMKVETPTTSGHSFILRRFDTGAISLTTMYRAAFPDGPEDIEKSEYQWVKETFDLAGTNGSSRDTSIPRLAGTWVPPEVALELSQEYAITPLISILVESKPEPGVHYRKSAKSAASTTAAPANPPPPAIAPPRFLNGVPASPAAASPPSKRRKESSPGPSPGPLPVVTPGKTAPRRSNRTRASPSPAPTPTRVTRARTKSPPVAVTQPTFGAAMSAIHSSDAPAPAKPPSTRNKPPSTRTAPSTPAKPASRKQTSVLIKKESRVSVAGSDETAVEDTPHASGSSYEKVVTTYETADTDAPEEPQHDEDEGHKVMSAAMEEMHRADIQEQKQMVSEIMAAGGRDMAVDAGPSTKRAREEDEDDLPKTFEPKEPEAETRLIKSNPRVSTIAPERKAAAWGTGLFVFGVGALTLLPNLASQWL